MKTTNEQIRPITQNSSTYHRLTNNTNNNALTQHVLRIIIIMAQELSHSGVFAPRNIRSPEPGSSSFYSILFLHT